MNQNDVVSSQSIMENLMSTFISQEGNELSSVWKNVVSQIKKNGDENAEVTFGERLAANSHVVDFKNGILLVESNHSGWVQYLKMYQDFILKGLSWKVPNLNIKSLAFRVAGSNAKLSDSYDDDVKKNQMAMKKRMEEQEKVLNSRFKDENINNDNEHNNLPPEVLAMFDRLRESAE